MHRKVVCLGGEGSVEAGELIVAQAIEGGDVAGELGSGEFGFAGEDLGVELRSG